MHLGIDIGTSKVAAVIVSQSGQIIAASSVPSHADTERGATRSEQRVTAILDAVDRAVLALPSSSREEVTAIGLTGQMHGVVCMSGNDFSPLITWEDGRCAPEEFSNYLMSKNITGLKTGFGCATLAWFAKNDPLFLNRYASAGTIQDLLAALLVGSSRMITDPSDAASWGCFLLKERKWDVDALHALSIPITLMPEIKGGGCALGQLTAARAGQWGMSPSVTVCNPIGDNQASVYATLQNPSEEMGITLGTGGQLSIVVDGFPNSSELCTGAEIRPFIGDQYLIVAASLCGGSAMRWLAESIASFCEKITGSPPDVSSIYPLLDSEGLSLFPGALTVGTSFRGERFDLSRRGVISGLSMDNFTIGELACGIARGTVTTLMDMFPRQLLQGRKRVVASGNGVRKLALVRKAIEHEFQLPLVLAEDREEAAYGAARIAGLSTT
ncbi:MAG: hypothetical protein RIS36_871 [Pseudomonadota bacterium]|jgi:sedoheptulokinase